MQMQIHLKVFKYKYKYMYITGNLSFDLLLNKVTTHR